MSVSIKQKAYQNLTVATGGTVTIDNGLITVSDPNIDRIVEYRITGTDTLVSDLIYTMTTPAEGTHIDILWKASLTPSGNTLTIFGKVIPSRLLTKTFLLKALYNGSAWETVIIVDNDETVNIDGSSIVDATVTDVKITAVAASKLTGTVADSQIAGMNANKLSGSIDPARYANNSIPAASIVNGSLTGTQLADGAVTQAKLASTGVLFVDAVGGATTAVTTPEVLTTYPLPANTLGSNNNAILIRAAYTFAATVTTKTASIEINGQTVYDSSVADPTNTSPNNERVYIEFLLVRTGATTAKIMGMSHMTNTSNTDSAPGIGTLTGLDFTSSQDIDFIGQNGTANIADIVCEMVVIEKVL